MYDTLLALHLLSAAVAFITIVSFSAWALGATVTRPGFVVADWAWNVSGAGLLIFGIWLALYVDGYEIWDGWILATLVLFAAASAFGAYARNAVLAADPAAPGGEAEEAGGTSLVLVWHWLRTLAILGILVLMVWKPGA